MTSGSRYVRLGLKLAKGDIASRASQQIKFRTLRPAEDSTVVKSTLQGTIFHENWWLEAVTQGRVEEVLVHKGGQSSDASRL